MKGEGTQDKQEVDRQIPELDISMCVMHSIGKLQGQDKRSTESEVYAATSMSWTAALTELGNHTVRMS